MDEYIKREDALDAVLFALVGTGVQSRALNAIHDVTAASVVEVVRCKDCVYYKPQTTQSQNWYSKTKYCCRSANVKVKENDFCSYGERLKNDLSGMR